MRDDLPTRTSWDNGALLHFVPRGRLLPLLRRRPYADRRPCRRLLSPTTRARSAAGATASAALRDTTVSDCRQEAGLACPNSRTIVLRIPITGLQYTCAEDSKPAFRNIPAFTAACRTCFPTFLGGQPSASAAEWPCGHTLAAADGRFSR